MADTDATSTEQPAARSMLDQRTPMRDGVELSSDVYLPAEGDGPWPAILHRTPYGNTDDLWVGIAKYFAGHGYAFVTQDVRGRFESGGAWEPFLNEGPDGYDAIEWVAAQPWCTGKVGTIGGSYGGYVQWVAARERPPHLAAIAASASGGRWAEELPFRFGTLTPFAFWWLSVVDGTPEQQEAADWTQLLTHRPLREIDIAFGGEPSPMWREWLAHDTFDDYYRQMSLVGHFQDIDVPALHVTGWFDNDQWGALHFWHGMVNESPAAERQWLLSGAWDHGGTRRPTQELNGHDFGPECVVDTDAAHLRFFDRWLKGLDNGQERDPRVKVFAMGVNEWRTDNVWPPRGTVETPFYLRSGGHANTAAGDGLLTPAAPLGDEPADEYAYDPDDPTPMVQNVAMLFDEDPSFDNGWRLERDDVLVYTSAPLTEPLEITGHPCLELHAASDGPDTDWHVTLCDVAPDGASLEFSTGAMRAAYREGSAVAPTPLEPGRVYPFRIELQALSNVWQPGHRLRVTVASANYPFVARNPNTNALPGDDADVRVARNTVQHSPAYPSRLLAPVVRRAR